VEEIILLINIIKMDSSTQNNSSTQIKKTSIFSWAHIIIAILIAVLIYIITIILKPSPKTNGGATRPPGPSTAKQCKSYKDCEPGGLCDNDKCINDFIPYGTNPFDTKIQEGRWRGGDDYTLEKIRAGTSFFLRGMRDDNTWCYLYIDDDDNLYNATSDDNTTIPASQFVFTVQKCPEGTTGFGSNLGFIQGNEKSTAVQCGVAWTISNHCHTEGKNTEEMCNEDSSWQLFEFENMPTDWLPVKKLPSIMGGNSGNGLRSPALQILLKYDNYLMYIEDNEMYTGAEDDGRINKPTRMLFQVAFVNDNSSL